MVQVLSIFVFLMNLSFSYGYIQLSSLKTKLFHKILINKKIKSDFKRISSYDAYQISTYWNDELTNACSEESKKCQNINMLYSPDTHVFNNSINLTDIKYDIISDINKKNTYYIWRPKIQICLPSLYLVENSNESEDEFQKTLLYPSFRETMHLLSLNMDGRNENIIVNNIVQSPYWNEPIHESYNLLQFSIKEYFTKYLKYPGLKYKYEYENEKY